MLFYNSVAHVHFRKVLSLPCVFRCFGKFRNVLSISCVSMFLGNGQDETARDDGTGRTGQTDGADRMDAMTMNDI